jgi:hypothetical protein
MAKVIPAAIGLGIEESQTWTMTPEEIIRAVEARAKQARNSLRVFDIHLARLTAFYGAAHGVKNTTPADYLTLSPETEEKKEAVPQSPEQQAFLLKLFAAIQERENKKRMAHHG